MAAPHSSDYVYRKIHLFAPFGENRVFLPGRKPSSVWLPLQCGETGFGLLACFDLRFPELARHLVWQGVDVLLVSALWPMSRREHFETLLKARAVENQCFVAAANACGVTRHIEFGGASTVITPFGSTEVPSSSDEKNLIAHIDLAEVNRARRRFLTVHPPRAWHHSSETKTMSLETLLNTTARRRRTGQKLVFTNGCFDILHAGHVSYLETARQQGDFLVVGLNSDVSIQAIKSPGRPVNSQALRARVLSGLGAVDYVVIFDEPTPLELIRALQPDVLVKGADWQEKDIVGADIVRGQGGRIVRIPFLHETSTTEIIRRITENF